MWKQAIPTGYEPGNVYVARSKGPPLQVKEREETTEEGNECIAIELKDMYGDAIKELGLGEILDTSDLRLAFQLSDARMLCANLISTLAETGDKVACRMQHNMRQAMEELEE